MIISYIIFNNSLINTWQHMLTDSLTFSEEYALLKSLSCGGYTNVLQDAVVWFSSGGTKSVLHYDSVDNINCLFDGTKELVMINKVGFV